MRPRDDESRIRVLRLLKSRFDVNDIDNLLRAIRDRCYGYTKIKDLGDFSAHSSSRDRGTMYEAITETYYMAQFVRLISSEECVTSDRLPSYIVCVLDGVFKRLSDQEIKSATSMKKSKALKVLRDIKGKLISNEDGTFALSPLNQDQENLFHVLTSKLPTTTVYDGKVLFSHFCAVLEKNGFLHPKEMEKFQSAEVPFILHVISLMHRAEILFPNDSNGRLAAGFAGASEGSLLQVSTTFPVIEKDQGEVRLGYTVMTTDLNAETYCEPGLLSLAKHTNGNSQNPAEWLCPIELVSGLKLSVMKA